jgi:hypothetical protein
MHAANKKNILESDLEVAPYEIDHFQINSALKLLNTSASYLDFSSERLETSFAKLLQSCMIAASFIPDNEVSSEATNCLEKLLKLFLKKDVLKVLSAYSSSNCS